MIRTKTKYYLYFLYFAVFCISILLLPETADAQKTFTSILEIPGLDGAKPDVEIYINLLLRIAIIAAALVAVVKLMIAGAKYIGSGVVTNKESAKKDIQSALLGLLIVVAAVTILTTINPDITNLPILEGAPSYDAVPFVETQTGFRTAFQPGVLGSTLNWTDATLREKLDFTSKCTGEVALNRDSSNDNIATCVIDTEAPLDVDLVANTTFSISQQTADMFMERDSRNQISNQVGVTLSATDLKGFASLDSIPGDDDVAFAIALEPNCVSVGGSHVAYTFFEGKHEFWCVGQTI